VCGGRSLRLCRSGLSLLLFLALLVERGEHGTKLLNQDEVARHVRRQNVADDNLARQLRVHMTRT
jgi:hypothetical protein